MKLRFSTLFLISCFSGLTLLPTSAFSQSAFWGFKGGVNFSKVGVGSLDVKKSMMGLGYHVGIFATFMTNNDRLSFTHELLYSQRACNMEINDSVTSKEPIRYLEIPWMVNYHMSPALYFSAGIQPAISTYLKNPINDTVRIYNRSNSIPIDFAFIIGAGGYLTEKIGIGARVNLSVVKAFDIDNSGKNMTMQFFVSYAVNREVRGKKRYSGGGGIR